MKELCDWLDAIPMPWIEMGIVGGLVFVLLVKLVTCTLSGRWIMSERQRKLTVPEEAMFYKYPVLKIPTGRRNEQLIIGLEKAQAIMTNLGAIREFVNKHVQERNAEQI